MEDWLLLREYRERGSEAAFTQLVQRHLDLVYATCLRELRDSELAEDTTQAVFLILARKAARLRPGTVLTGWLYHTARLTARNARRGEARRRAREARTGAEAMRLQTAPAGEAGWEALEPLLHEALATLKAGEHEALLLRYFEGCSLKEVGVTLGISENGAHMRITRALEKLRLFFRRRGLLVSPTGLAGLLTAEAVAPANAALAAERITALAIGTVRDGTPVSARIYELTEGVLREMKTMLLKKVALGGLTLSLVGGGLAVTASALDAPPAAPPAPTPTPPANAAARPRASSPQKEGQLRAELQRGAPRNEPLEIIPRVGVGPIRFGMSAADMRKVVGEPYRISGSAHEYQRLGLAVMLDRDQKVAAILIGAWCESSDVLLDVFKGATREGVKLRSTRRQVVDTYGKPDSTETAGVQGQEFEVLKYDALRAQFAFRKDKLVHITLKRPASPTR